MNKMLEYKTNQKKESISIIGNKNIIGSKNNIISNKNIKEKLKDKKFNLIQILLSFVFGITASIIANIIYNIF